MKSEKEKQKFQSKIYNFHFTMERSDRRFAVFFAVCTLICFSISVPYGSGVPDSYKEATAPTLPSVQPQLITHGTREYPFVALTFDACETKKKAGYDVKIIRILKKTGTPATLFLGGKWMESHPDETRSLAKEPLFELGNHSYIHPHLTQISDTRIHDEMKKTQDIMFRLTGKQAALFRCPYGEYNLRVLKIAAKLGLRVVQWDVESGDPDRHFTANKIVSAVVSRVRYGSIVVMHINGRGWHTAEALPVIIQKLKAKGYRFAKVSDMLKYW